MRHSFPEKEKENQGVLPALVPWKIKNGNISCIGEKKFFGIVCTVIIKLTWTGRYPSLDVDFLDFRDKSLFRNSFVKSLTSSPDVV